MSTQDAQIHWHEQIREITQMANFDMEDHVFNSFAPGRFQ